VYSDHRVKDLIASRFVAVRVHVRENAAEWQTLSSQFGVQWTPTILVVDADGEERHRIEGFLPAEDFLSQVELGLAHAAFNRGDYPAAEHLFRDVARKYPDTDAAPEALYWAGVAKFRATNDPAALKETNADVSGRYPASSWAKKASVWQ
jgi:Tetratricopeptide repeat/Thioredoxin-like domain